MLSSKLMPEHVFSREDQASNTLENAQLSLEVLIKNGVTVNKAIIVCKNYHARRALMTYQSVFPSTIEFSVAPVVDGKGITKDNWYKDVESARVVMGEVQRIGQYFTDTIVKFGL